MELIRSTQQPFLTLDYMTQELENKLFDRKSARVKPSDLAETISAFANADGGTIVIGIDEKTREIEGVNSIGGEKLNDLISAPKNHCAPMPSFRDELLDVVNKSGQPDKLLLIHIEPSQEQIVRTLNGSTFLRVGDKSKELKGEDLRNLEYSKSLRLYEDECSTSATINDLDEELLSEYREKLQATNLTYEQLLTARGFIREQRGETKLTNAAVLLFAKNIVQFYSNCRIRFIRYDGSKARTGADINIIRDHNIELPILRIIQVAKEFIGTQLREFMSLDLITGKFNSVPEYPEFAWLEGIVNAVTHREYAMAGRYILVSMYDDRLEIESPGKLPSVVTIDNIKETRYSRNPRIARVLTEFGWVRELNEGVKRIYADMEKFFLDEPVYSEPEQSVKLVLKNNYVMRSLRRKARAEELVSGEVWASLDEIDHTILALLVSSRDVSRLDISKRTGRSMSTVGVHLRKMISMNIIKANGSKHDPARTYSIINKD